MFLIEQQRLLERYRETGDLMYLIAMDDDPRTDYITTEWLHTDFASPFVSMARAFQCIGILSPGADPDYWGCAAAALRRARIAAPEAAARLTDALLAQSRGPVTRSMRERVFTHVSERFAHDGLCGLCESGEDDLYDILEIAGGTAGEDSGAENAGEAPRAEEVSL